MAQELGFDAAPQDLVMTLLGAHVRQRAGGVWSGGLVRLLGEFGFSPGAARVALTRLVARDMLSRRKSGRLVHYTLTARCEAVLAEGDDRIFTLGTHRHSDDEWTVLWHTIPESRRLERTRLTRRLRFLGFGQLQDGTWIAPRNHERRVTAMLGELAVRDHAAVLIGRPTGGLDLRGFVTRIWDIADLAARYREFVTTYRGYASEAARDALDDREALLLRTRLTHTFRQFPFLDPELPHRLVPAPEHRAEAVRLFHDLYAALAAPAQRHFDQVTAP